VFTPTVFTFDRWNMHRDAQKRYQRHLTFLFRSGTWQNLAMPVAGMTLVAAATCLYESLLSLHLLPAWLPSFQMSDGPFELTSFALSLLLVFRTDSSYGRWMEGMNTWSEVKAVTKGGC